MSAPGETPKKAWGDEVVSFDLTAAARDFKMRNAKVQPSFRPKGRYRGYLLRTTSRRAFVMTLIMMDAAEAVLTLAGLLNEVKTGMREMNMEQAKSAYSRATRSAVEMERVSRSLSMVRA